VFSRVEKRCSVLFFVNKRLLQVEILLVVGYTTAVLITGFLPDYGFFILLINLFVVILIFFGFRLAFLNETERGIETSGDVVGYIILLGCPLVLIVFPILAVVIAFIGLIAWSSRTLYELSLMSELEKLNQDQDQELYWTTYAELYREKIKSHFELDA